MRRILPWTLLALLVCAALGSADLVEPRKYDPSETIPPLSARSYLVAFKANEPGKIQISGNGHTNLGLYVFDAEGNCVALDDGTTPQTCDELGVEWIPIATGRYNAVIRNGGLDVNDYHLAIR